MGVAVALGVDEVWVCLPTGGLYAKLVDQTSSRHGLKVVGLVVVSHCTAQLIIVHLVFLFVVIFSPHLGHLLCLYEAELPFLRILPCDYRRACLRVEQQVTDEFPKLSCLLLLLLEFTFWLFRATRTSPLLKLDLLTHWTILLSPFTTTTTTTSPSIIVSYDLSSPLSQSTV